MLNANLTALAATALAREITPEESANFSQVFLTEKIGGPSYTEASFVGHMEAVKTYGDSYLDFINNLRAQPAMASVYGFMVASGPTAIYGLMESMGAAGLLDKKKVASAAKLPSKTGARAERAYFRQIWDELSKVAFDAASAKFVENRDAYVKRFPEIDAESIATLTDLLRVCGKSTLNAGVAKMKEPHTGQECALALGWRLDVHSPKRNGGWDAKLNDGAGDFTADYKKAAEKAAAEAASLDQASAEKALHDVALELAGQTSEAETSD